MPPEQARGERVDARADLYAVAVVCFEMLALRNYVKRGTLNAMMEASAKPAFMKPSEFRPDVPPGLDSVLQRALAPDKESRYQTARQFLNALRQVVPPAHTEGGMTALLDELFGATRQEREEEIASLLLLPVPDPTDAEPTKVFVTRAGVLPPDQQPTRFVPQEAPSLLPTVRRDLRPHDAPTTIPPSLMSSNQLTAPRPTVSIPVLIAAVFAAAIIGGAVAVVLVNRLNPAPQIVNIEVDPSPVLEPRAAAAEAVAAPAPAPQEEPPPPAVREKKRPPPPSRVTQPPPPAPPTTVSNEALNAELDRLREKANALKSSVSDPKRKDELIRYLSDLSVWKRTNDVERKKQALVELEERLRRLD
jgi:hypothetical protein